jgi:hypothetical protein
MANFVGKFMKKHKEANVQPDVQIAKEIALKPEEKTVLKQSA